MEIKKLISLIVEEKTDEFGCCNDLRWLLKAKTGKSLRVSKSSKQRIVQKLAMKKLDEKNKIND